MVVVSIYIRVAISSVVSIDVTEMNIALSDNHDQVDFKLPWKLFSAELVEKNLHTCVFSADLEETAKEHSMNTLRSTQWALCIFLLMEAPTHL